MKFPKKERKSFDIHNSEKSNKRSAIIQEKNIAKEIGGRLTPQSGTKKFFPADIYTDNNKIIDVKSALKASQISVTEEMLVKLEDEALRMHKDPVLLLSFPKSKKLVNKKWVCIPMGDIEL